MRILPALFNTDMTRAILDVRKTATRRVAFPNKDFHEFPRPDNPDAWWFRGRMYRSFDDALCSPQGVMSLCKYRPGDVLYVRETWCWCPCWDCGHDSESGCTETPSSRFYNEEKREYGCYGFKASFADNEQPFDRWRPSIHMPREAARIWLRVTDVRVERLQEITVTDLQEEGLIPSGFLSQYTVMTAGGEWFGEWEKLWDSTIKPADRDKYGWAANPWVWVIRFERCGKPDEFGH